jgi:hypothetical protein
VAAELLSPFSPAPRTLPITAPRLDDAAMAALASSPPSSAAATAATPATATATVSVSGAAPGMTRVHHTKMHRTHALTPWRAVAAARPGVPSAANAQRLAAVDVDVRTLEEKRR